RRTGPKSWTAWGSASWPGWSATPSEPAWSRRIASSGAAPRGSSPGDLGDLTDGPGRPPARVLDHGGRRQIGPEKGRRRGRLGGISLAPAMVPGLAAGGRDRR